MLFKLFEKFVEYILPNQNKVLIEKEIKEVDRMLYDSIKKDIYPYKRLFNESYLDSKNKDKNKKRVTFNYLDFLCLRILRISSQEYFVELKKDFKLFLMDVYSKEVKLFEDEDFIDQYEFVKQLFTFWNIHVYNGIKNKSGYDYDKLYDKFNDICFPSVIIGETEFVYSVIFKNRLSTEDYNITSDSIWRYEQDNKESYAEKVYKEKIELFKNNKYYKKKGSPFNCYVHQKTFLEPIIKLLKEHNKYGKKVMLNYEYEFKKI